MFLLVVLCVIALLFALSGMISAHSTRRELIRLAKEYGFNIDKSPFGYYRIVEGWCDDQQRRHVANRGEMRDELRRTAARFDSVDNINGRLANQFALLCSYLGLRLEQEKVEETHQGDRHEAKVTPAHFVKARKR